MNEDGLESTCLKFTEGFVIDDDPQARILRQFQIAILDLERVLQEIGREVKEEGEVARVVKTRVFEPGAQMGAAQRANA